jgi:hypothetical protein
VINVVIRHADTTGAHADEYLAVAGCGNVDRLIFHDLSVN